MHLSYKNFVIADNVHPRLHAKLLDKLIGYKIPKIEVKLLQKFRAYDQCIDESNRKKHYNGTQAWIGLHPQALQTPYCDIYKALKLFEGFKIDHVVDIGSGYGRVGVVLSTLFPSARFTGYEIVKQRQVEGNRVFKKLGLDNCNIERSNVLEIDIPCADIYFIYDFSEEEDISKVLERLSKRSALKKYYLIMRGDRVDYLMKHKFKHVWRKYKSVKDCDLQIYTSDSVYKEKLCKLEQ